MIAGKKMAASLLCMLAAVVINNSCAAVSLTEAIKNSWVSATIRGFDYRQDTVYRSSFYGKCLVLTCKNLRSEPIEISELPGRFFQPDDSSIQRMVLTAAVNLRLNGKEESNLPIYAMCSEAHDGAPDATTRFHTGKMASNELLSVVNFIAQHHYQNDAAQQAIWCITDQYSPYSIFSDDTAVTHQLRKFVCSTLHMPYQEETEALEKIPLFRSVSGDFTYTIQRTKKVDLIIYNEAGQEIRKLVNGETQTAGTYQYDYHFNLPINEDALSKQALIIKFFLNGRLIAERKHVLK